MTTFEPKLVDPRSQKALIYKGFCLAFFTGK
jgi:hypothetical protein